MEGQFVFDFGAKKCGISHDVLCEHCKHRSWLKGATETEPATWMCGFANGQTAKCWDDWIPCTCENCILLKE